MLLLLMAMALLMPVSAQVPVTQANPDALLLFKQGRDLDLANKRAEAVVKYRQAIEVCDEELAIDPGRMDAYTVKCWSLFRLDRFREVIDLGNTALRIKYDPRIIQTMGEAYFHLGDDALALRSLQRYVDSVGEWGDRVATAYFYMAESYFRMARYDHADIAYAMAVYREPNLARWWFRYAGAVEALGDHARAFDLYGRALKLSPSMVDAQQGQARVKARM
jgi:tetratricopeptide (TPR) repeat protein